MRKVIFVSDEYYHIVNRGSNKQQLFIDSRDYIRFLFLILHLQSPMVLSNIGRQVSHFVKSRAFNISEEEQDEIAKQREVFLHAFCIMPNHFHLLVSEKNEKGISRYLHRVQTAYGKYFNTRYKVNGHVFQGPFRAVLIEDNEQFLHLTSYIHRNPRELSMWQKTPTTYPWSSYSDFVEASRWSSLLVTNPILEQFSSKNEYNHFVRTSPAKLLKAELLTVEEENKLKNP